MGYMLNSVHLQGRLTADPDLRYTQGPEPFATMLFTLASDNGKDRDGNERPANFIGCRASGRTAELIADYCRKGDMILIEGSIAAGSYDGRDGERKYYTNVAVKKVIFIDVTGKNGEGRQQGPAADPSSPPGQSAREPQYQQRSQRGQGAPAERGSRSADRTQQGRQGRSGRRPGSERQGRTSTSTVSEDEYFQSMADYEYTDEMPFQ